MMGGEGGSLGEGRGGEFREGEGGSLVRPASLFYLGCGGQGHQRIQEGEEGAVGVHNRSDK